MTHSLDIKDGKVVVKVYQYDPMGFDAHHTATAEMSITPNEARKMGDDLYTYSRLAEEESNG